MLDPNPRTLLRSELPMPSRCLAAYNAIPISGSLQCHPDIWQLTMPSRCLAAYNAIPMSGSLQCHPDVWQLTMPSRCLAAYNAIPMCGSLQCHPDDSQLTMPSRCLASLQCHPDVWQLTMPSRCLLVPPIEVVPPAKVLILPTIHFAIIPIASLLVFFHIFSTVYIVSFAHDPNPCLSLDSKSERSKSSVKHFFVRQSLLSTLFSGVGSSSHFHLGILLFI